MDVKYNQLIEAILDGEVDAGIAEAKNLVSSGTEPVAIFSECIQDTLNDLGDRFSKTEIFLPDLMIASDVVKAIQDELSPLMRSSTSISHGRAVIGTAFGDVHDIGKNMVSMMLQVNGFEVKDLGVGVEPSRFIEEAEAFHADLILISGLMMPSLPYMKDTIDRVKENPDLKNRYKIMVGGGPVTQMWADQAGADGYSDDAISAVWKAKELLGIA